MQKDGESGKIRIMAACSPKTMTYGEVSAARMINSEIPRFKLMIVSMTYGEVLYDVEGNQSYDPPQISPKSRLDPRRATSL
jgi:hypothetical protein